MSDTNTIKRLEVEVELLNRAMGVEGRFCLQAVERLSAKLKGLNLELEARSGIESDDGSVERLRSDIEMVTRAIKVEEFFNIENAGRWHKSLWDKKVELQQAIEDGKITKDPEFEVGKDALFLKPEDR